VLLYALTGCWWLDWVSATQYSAYCCKARHVVTPTTKRREGCGLCDETMAGL
jgi:hypothetical protein